MAAISPARKAAFDILLAVERGHAHSDDLLRGKAVSALAPADRNLATALVLGVLRWQIRLDRELQGLLKRPNARLDAEVRIALRLGAFQILHLDRIPARAAIDESVELAKQAGHRFASGMVNAVLRKLGASRAAKTAESTDVLYQGTTAAVPKPAPNKGGALQTAEKLAALKGHDFSRAISIVESSRPLGPEGCFSGDSSAVLPFSAASLAPASALALAAAHPLWMVERWVGFYGLETARAICWHGQTQPTPMVRLASPAVEAELAAAGIELGPGELLTAARIVLAGDVASTTAFREGRVRFQDEGSQLIAELAAEPVQNQGKILDACAAPGGKTLILAERNPNTRIVACEANPQRLARVRERLAAYAERIECRLADATALTDENAFDAALVDAPCSGTGTLGRNPEIRHQLKLDDLPRQAERQRAILRAALRAVRPGGNVVYSTCSMEPEENEQVVAAVLAENPKARWGSLEARIETLLRVGMVTPSGAERLRGSITPEGALRLLPGVFCTDGFLIVLIERTG